METSHIIESIINNYKELEKSIVAQLTFKVPNHHATEGAFREEIWKQMFEQIIPKKYVIEQSVFLIDSDGHVSREVDLAIFDEMYTPYIFRKGRIKFIPVEAVAVVVQCKSKNVNNIDRKSHLAILPEWCDSIDQLETESGSITRMASNINIGAAPTQSGTRPIKILCALKKPKEENEDSFDFSIIVNNKTHHISVNIVNKKEKSLWEWYADLNLRGKPQKKPSEVSHPKIMDNRTLNNYKIIENGEEVPLLSLNFQLNQLLMLINNPMLFPHMAYVQMFNNVGKEIKDDGKIANLQNRSGQSNVQLWE